MPRHARPPRRRPFRTALVAAAAALLGTLIWIPIASTHAGFSDYGDLNRNSASAAVWQPDPSGLAECNFLAKYTKHSPPSLTYVTTPGATMTAAKNSIVIVTATGVQVTARPHTCIVVTVGGVTITNVDSALRLVLAYPDDVLCQMAHKPASSKAVPCSQLHPKVVVSVAATPSSAPQVAGGAAPALPSTTAPTPAAPAGATPTATGSAPGAPATTAAPPITAAPPVSGAPPASNTDPPAPSVPPTTQPTPAPIAGPTSDAPAASEVAP